MKSQRVKKIIKNSIIMGIGNKSQGVLIFLQSVLVARCLGVANYGKWAIVMTLCVLIMSLFSIKIQDVLGKFLVELRVKEKFHLLRMVLKETILIEFVMRLFGFVTICSLSSLFSRWQQGADTQFLYMVYGLHLFLQFLDGTWFSLERDHGTYPFMAFIGFLQLFIRLVFVSLFFLVLNKANLYSLVICFPLSSGFVSIIKLARIKKLLQNYGGSSLMDLVTVRIQSKLSMDNSTYQVLREYRQFMKSNYFSTFFMRLIRNMDILATGLFFSQQYVGQVKLAKNLARMIQEFAGIMGIPIYQEFNEMLTAGKKKKISTYLNMNFKYYLAILFTALLLASILVEPVIKWVYGDEFLNTSVFFKYYLFMVFIALVSFWAHPLMLALGGWDFKLKMLLLAVIALPLVVLGSKAIWGIVGIIIGIILIRIFLNLSFIWFCWKELKTA